MVKRWMLLWLLTVILIACGGDSNDSNNEQRRLFDWDKSADVLLFRIDEIDPTGSEFSIANTLPPCTIYGNGRLIMTIDTENDMEVLEARLSEDRLRAFIEDVIGLGFYSWEDNLLQDSTDPVLRSVSLNLYAENRTVERYGEWPAESFERLVEDCRNIAVERARVEPLNGGWLRAVPAPDAEIGSAIRQWPRNAPFSLQEVAISGSPLWVDDPAWANFLWDITLETDLVPVFEGEDSFYISFLIPDISRSSPPSPVIGD